MVDPKSIAPGGAARGSGPRDSGRMGCQEFKLDELPPILQGWVHALVPVGLELMHYNRVTQTHCLVFRAVPPPGPREMHGSSSVDSPGQHAAGLPIAWDEGRSVQTCDAGSSKKRSQRRALAKAEAENLLACAPRIVHQRRHEPGSPLRVRVSETSTHDPGDNAIDPMLG